MNMNIGIVGFGLIGQQRAHDIKHIAGCQLKAVYDVNVDLVKKFQDQYHYDIESSWEKLIQRSDLDLVIIAVPHFLAPTMAIAAINNNKHVLCEKPMGRNILEARQILEALDGKKIFFGAGFNYRFYPGIKKAKQLIAADKIGKITHVRCVLGHGGRPGMQEEWKASKEQCGGGALLDPGIHGIDLFRFLFGEIAEGLLVSKNSFWNLEVEDNAFINLNTKNNVFISAHFSITEWKSLFRLEIFGTDGYIFITGRSKSYGAQKVVVGKRWFWRDNSTEEKEEFLLEDDSFREELATFIKTIQGEQSDVLALSADGLRAITVVDELYKNNNRMIKF